MTSTEDLEITTATTDFMYATTLTYQIWEYPVILNGNVVIGNIVLTEPGDIRQQYFSSKSGAASAFRHQYEVGNLLSYTSSINVPSDDVLVRSSAKSDTFGLSPGGLEFDWLLTRSGEDFEENSYSLNFSLGASLSFEAPSPYLSLIHI